MAIGRRELGLILDAAQALRAARDVDQTLDRIGKTAQTSARAFDSGFQRATSTAQSSVRSMRAVEEQLASINREVRNGGGFADVLAARLRVAGREWENYAKRVQAAEERQRKLNEVNQQTSKGGLLARAGGALGDGFQQYALGAFAGGAGLAAVNFTAERVRAAIDGYREIQRSDRFLQSASRLTGSGYATNTAIASRLRGEFGTGIADTNTTLAAALSFTTAAGRQGDTERFLRTLGDLAVASGRDLKELPELIAQISAGTDEATDKLLQANPSVVYEKYALSVGKTAAALTDAEKKQALLNAVIEKGSRVQGAANAALRDSIGGYDAAVQKLSDMGAKFAGIALSSQTARDSVEGLRIAVDALDSGGGESGFRRWLQNVGLSRGAAGRVEAGAGAGFRGFVEAAIPVLGAASIPARVQRLRDGDQTQRPAFDLFGGASNSVDYLTNLVLGAEIAERERRNRDAIQAQQIYVQHQQQLERLQNVGEPLADVRARYSDRERELDADYAAKKIDQGAYTQSRLAISVERDTELSRVRRDTTFNLAQQFDTLRAEYTGQSNPLKQVLEEGEIQARAVHEQLKKLGPEFEGQAQKIEAATRRLRGGAFADALAGNIRNISSLNSRIREIQDAPYGEGQFAIPANEVARDSRALETRGIDRLLNQITGQSEPGPELDEQRQLFEDAQGLGGPGISRRAAINRLMAAASTGKLDRSRITIDQQGFLASIFGERKVRLAGYRDPESPEERIQRVFGEADDFAGQLKASGQIKGTKEEQDAEIERRRRGYVLSALAGTSASDYARSPGLQSQYLDALTKERDTANERQAEALDYAKRSALALEKLSPAEGDVTLGKIITAASTFFTQANIKATDLKSAVELLAKGSTVQINIIADKKFSLSAQDQTPMDRVTS